MEYIDKHSCRVRARARDWAISHEWGFTYSLVLDLIIFFVVVYLFLALVMGTLEEEDIGNLDSMLRSLVVVYLFARILLGFERIIIRLILSSEEVKAPNFWCWYVIINNLEYSAYKGYFVALFSLLKIGCEENCVWRSWRTIAGEIYLLYNLGIKGCRCNTRQIHQVIRVCGCGIWSEILGSLHLLCGA